MQEAIVARFSEKGIVTESSNEARQLAEKGFGVLKKSHVVLSLFEAYYLMENGKLKIPKTTEESFLRKARKYVRNFLTSYTVFRDLRDRGYTVKTALKFGADFRVYEKGIKPGEDHAKWIVYPVHQSEHLTWHEFSAKNRVAHSTKKHLLIAIVDDEEDITYYEVAWKRP